MRPRIAAVPLLLFLTAAAGGRAAMVTRPPASAPAGLGRVTLPLPPMRPVAASASASAPASAPASASAPSASVGGGLPPPLQPSAASVAGTALNRLTTATHVIRGTPVTAPDAYPYIVDLSTSPTAVSSTRFCGGSLIAPDIVLTAGHCVVAVLSGEVAADAAAADGGASGGDGDNGRGEAPSSGGGGGGGGGDADDARSPDGHAAGGGPQPEVRIYAVIGRHQLADDGEPREQADTVEGGPSVRPAATSAADAAAEEASLPPPLRPRRGGATAPPSQPIRVLAAAVHPAYTGLGSPGDVAVLLLERPSAARPVALAAAAPPTGTPATVVGFGVKALGTLEGVGVNVAVLPRRLQATTLTVAERSFCEPPGAAGDSDSGGGGGSGGDGNDNGNGGDGDRDTAGGRLPPGVLCTKPVVAGASACSGDSGSALVAPAAVTAGTAARGGRWGGGRGDDRPDVLVGVVSFGDAACAARDAGVFTDVAAVRGWIEAGVVKLHAAAAMATALARPLRLG